MSRPAACFYPGQNLGLKPPVLMFAIIDKCGSAHQQRHDAGRLLRDVEQDEAQVDDRRAPHVICHVADREMQQLLNGA